MPWHDAPACGAREPPLLVEDTRATGSAVGVVFSLQKFFGRPSQYAAQNSCHRRLAPRADRVLHVDLDEFVVPAAPFDDLPAALAHADALAAAAMTAAALVPRAPRAPAAAARGRRGRARRARRGRALGAARAARARRAARGALAAARLLRAVPAGRARARARAAVVRSAAPRCARASPGGVSRGKLVARGGDAVRYIWDHYVRIAGGKGVSKSAEADAARAVRLAHWRFDIRFDQSSADARVHGGARARRAARSTRAATRGSGARSSPT